MDNARSNNDNTLHISFIPAYRAISKAVDNLSTGSLHVYDRRGFREKKWIIVRVVGIAA